MLNKAKGRYLIIALLVLISLFGADVCGASNINSPKCLPLDSVINAYNDMVIKDELLKPKDLSDVCLAKYKEMHKEMIDEKVIYVYGLGGRDDQIIRFFINANNDVVGIDAILQMQSPVVLWEIEKSSSHIVAAILGDILDASGIIKGMKPEELIKLRKNLENIGLFRKGDEIFVFYNDDRRYCVEKTFDRKLWSIKIAICVE